MKRLSRLTTIICIVFLYVSSLTACHRTGLSQLALSPTEIQSAPTPGDVTRNLVYGGIERSYIVHTPPDLDTTQPVPVVLAFHGVGLDANEMIRISGLNDLADESGFLVVYPNGTGGYKSWNAGHCCGEAAKNNVDDIGFVRTLVAEISKSINIDPKRIYATGFSNGAIFTYRVACELSDLVAAVAPVSATPIIEDMETCEPAHPLPVIHFHGTADEANPYNGGESLGGYQFVSVSAAVDFWVEHNGCTAQALTVETGTIRHDVYSPCDSGTAVELYTVAEGMHAWPGGEAVNLKMGVPTTDISASRLMWEFFISHPLP